MSETNSIEPDIAVLMEKNIKLEKLAKLSKAVTTAQGEILQKLADVHIEFIEVLHKLQELYLDDVMSQENKSLKPNDFLKLGSFSIEDIIKRRQKRQTGGSWDEL